MIPCFAVTASVSVSCTLKSELWSNRIVDNRGSVSRNSSRGNWTKPGRIGANRSWSMIIEESRIPNRRSKVDSQMHQKGVEVTRKHMENLENDLNDQIFLSKSEFNTSP